MRMSQRKNKRMQRRMKSFLVVVWVEMEETILT